nr:9471_t:CDS:2 [Entrophospora candida]
MAAGDSLSYRTRTAMPSSTTMTLNTEELEEIEAGNSNGIGGREEINGDTSNPVGTLKLRGGGPTDRKVKWDEDVIDNEGLGRKKSKGI